jgi:hypothetical protein
VKRTERLIRNLITTALSGEFDLERLIQLIIDSSVEAIGAKFGALFCRAAASIGGTKDQ